MRLTRDIVEYHKYGVCIYICCVLMYVDLLHKAMYKLCCISQVQTKNAQVLIKCTTKSQIMVNCDDINKKQPVCICVKKACMDLQKAENIQYYKYCLSKILLNKILMIIVLNTHTRIYFSGKNRITSTREKHLIGCSQYKRGMVIEDRLSLHTGEN